MIITGSQVRAARAMIGMGQRELAEAAGLCVNSVVNIESKGANTLRSGHQTMCKIQVALEAKGLEFIGMPLPGVKFARWPVPKASDAEKGPA